MIRGGQMKYFRDLETGDVYAYEADGSQDEYIKEGLVPMSEAEVDAHINPPPPPPSVPAFVSRAQGKAALIQAGKWADVLAFVDLIEDPTEKALAEVALHDTQIWRRDSPLLLTITGALGLTEEQVDNLFLAASDIWL